MFAKKWFDEKFLSSLYEKAGEQKETWLTAKQTSICLENMNVSIMQDEFGLKHKIASYEWKQKTIKLFFSQKNGCGKILFGAEPLPLFDERGKDIDCLLKIIRFLFNCKTKRDLAVFTNWSEKKVLELTAEGTEIQDLYFSAYRKAVGFQSELLRCSGTELTKQGLEKMFEQISKRKRRNEKFLSYIKNRIKGLFKYGD